MPTPAGDCRSQRRTPAGPTLSEALVSAAGCRFRRFSSAQSAALAGHRRRCRLPVGRRLIDADTGAVGQAVLGVGHDLLADREALADYGDAVLRRLDFEGSSLD